MRAAAFARTACAAAAVLAGTSVAIAQTLPASGSEMAVSSPSPSPSSSPSPSTPKTADRLERVVIVMRHGVRSAMSSPAELGRYSRYAWPAFAVPPGHLTARGATLVTMLGGWYRAEYRHAGLLGDGDCSVYYWANLTQRTEATAQALSDGLTPGCKARVHHAAAAPDPLFDAPLTPLAPLDPNRMLAAMSARVGGDLAAWDARQAADRDRFEALLLQCRDIPCTGRERARVKRRLGDTPIVMGIGNDGRPAVSSPSLQVAGIAESLVMAYADGLAFPHWRGIDAKTIGRALIVHGAGIDLRTRTPEVGRQTSSYLAMRVLATLQRGARMTALADPIGESEKVVVVSGHDGTVTMLAGLLGLDWKLDDYGAGEAAPGGALVFEVWRLASTGEPAIRVRYVAQGLDQMRNLVPLTAGSPPQSVVVRIPSCGDPGQLCPLADFARHIVRAVTSVTPG